MNPLVNLATIISIGSVLTLPTYTSENTKSTLAEANNYNGNVIQGFENNGQDNSRSRLGNNIFEKSDNDSYDKSIEKGSSRFQPGFNSEGIDVGAKAIVDHLLQFKEKAQL